MKRYSANWSRLLIVVSASTTVLCIGTAIVLLQTGGAIFRWMALLPVALLVGAALFTVRGYEVGGDGILVRRLFWSTRLPLEGLSSANYEPEAMRSSVRLMGNGGLFSFTGYYWSKRLGRFRAFVTDLRRTVVLRYVDRTMLLSPEEPDSFAKELEERIGKRGGPTTRQGMGR